jgi:hypothetical protein
MYRHMFSFLLVTYLGVELLGHIKLHALPLEGLPDYSKGVVPFYIPLAALEGPTFSTFLPTLVIVHNQVVSHCGFHSHFLSD